MLNDFSSRLLRARLREIAVAARSAHTDDRYALITGDSLELLGRLPTGSIDLIFADPPYHLSNGGATCRSGARAPVGKGAWDESQGLAADHAFHARWLRICQRLLAPHGTLWVSGTRHCIFSIGFAMQQAGWHLLNLITWSKPSAPPNLGCRTLTESCEHLIWAAPQRTQPLRHVFNYAELRRENGGKQLRDAWSIGPASRAERGAAGHPAQKPLALVARCIRAASNPGAVVLDPFVGSGTTAVAALQLGRLAVGFDESEPWISHAASRVRSLRLQRASRAR